jgi:hypothetical protein
VVVVGLHLARQLAQALLQVARGGQAMMLLGVVRCPLAQGLPWLSWVRAVLA